MSFAALSAQKVDIKLRTVKEPTSAWVVKKSHADNFQSCPLFKKYLRKKEMDLLGRQIPTGHVNIGTRFKGKANSW